MGRLPKIRISYFNDAQYMLRLMQALEMDKTRPLAWRKKRMEELQQLAHEFLNAPTVSAGVG